MTQLYIHTLGGFHVWSGYHNPIPPTAWGREKALHLFQFLVTNRDRPLHKEQIIDQLWPRLDARAGDRDFKVALNAIQKAIEPEREPRAPSRFIQRLGLAYRLNLEEIAIDADDFEREIAAGNAAFGIEKGLAIRHYEAALRYYVGEYLPERRYEDWTSSERERLHTLALGTLTRLAELRIADDPLESLRLTERVLSLEPAWEEAYRVQIQAFLKAGNRLMAIRSYEQCAQFLAQEYGLDPLPETQALLEQLPGSMSSATQP